MVASLAVCIVRSGLIQIFLLPDLFSVDGDLDGSSIIAHFALIFSMMIIVMDP